MVPKASTPCTIFNQLALRKEEDSMIIYFFEDFNHHLLILKAWPNSKVLDNIHSASNDWENCGFGRSLFYVISIFYTLSKAVAFTADTPLLKRLDNAI